VANAREHGRALLDVLGDAVAHLDERLRRLAYFPRAARAEVIGKWAALSEGVRGFRKAQDGADLITQEQDGDGEENYRCADHP
jgi:hypothetical protein